MTFSLSTVAFCVCRIHGSLSNREHAGVGKGHFSLCKTKKRDCFESSEELDWGFTAWWWLWHRCLGLEALPPGPEVSTVGICCLVVLETLFGGVWVHVSLLQSAGKAHVEVNTASSPYINHHMSSFLNKMYSWLYFPWTLTGNIFVSCPANTARNSFRPDLESLYKLLWSDL